MKVGYLFIGMAVLFVAGVLVNSSYAKIDPKTCVGMWLFDEGKGDIASDSSGNKNDGTLKDGPKWVDGKLGKALSFDGAATVDCGNDSSIQLTTIGSVSMWFKPAAAFSGNTGTQQHLMFGGPKEFYFSASSSKLFYFLSDDATGIGSNSVSWNTQWYHVIVTSDGSVLKMYIDGVQEPQTASLGALQFFVNTGNLLIGRPGIPFKGLIDEVAIFNVPLAVQDIQTIMNKGLKESLNPTAVDLSGKLTTTWAGIKAR